MTCALSNGSVLLALTSHASRFHRGSGWGWLFRDVNPFHSLSDTVFPEGQDVGALGLNGLINQFAFDKSDIGVAGLTMIEDRGWQDRQE
jgi:hypothetical protein